jgi:hypothetical protein
VDRRDSQNVEEIRRHEVPFDSKALPHTRDQQPGVEELGCSKVLKSVHSGPVVFEVVV